MKRFSFLLIVSTLFILFSGICNAQVDVHSHMIPDSYLEAVKAHGMEMDEGFPIPSWDIDAHLQFMMPRNRPPSAGHSMKKPQP